MAESSVRTPGEAAIGAGVTGFGCRGRRGSRDGNGAPQKLYLAGKPQLVCGLQVWAIFQGFKTAFAVPDVPQDEDGSGREDAFAE